MQLLITCISCYCTFQPAGPIKAVRELSTSTGIARSSSCSYELRNLGTSNYAQMWCRACSFIMSAAVLQLAFSYLRSTWHPSGY